MYAKIKAAVTLLWQAAAILLPFLAKNKGKAREIFEYFDGKEHRKADPMIIYRKVLSDPECNLREDLTAIDAGDWEAYDRVQALAKRVFGLVDYAQGGLTQMEADELLARFLTYVHNVKKKRRELRIQSQHSESKQSGTSAKSTTKRSVVLSGTQDESKNAAHITSSPQSAQAPVD